MNFSRVISDRPSMFMAFLETKWAKDLIFLAAQSGLVQIRTSVSTSRRICVCPPQTGHREGISRESDMVRFSEIWGMIMLAL